MAESRKVNSEIPSLSKCITEIDHSDKVRALRSFCSYNGFIADFFIRLIQFFWRSAMQAVYHSHFREEETEGARTCIARKWWCWHLNPALAECKASHRFLLAMLGVRREGGEWSETTKRTLSP